ELPSPGRHVAYRGLQPRAYVERLAVIFLAQVQRGVYERLACIVHVHEVARDVRADELRVPALDARYHDVRDEARGVLQRAIHGVEAQVGAGETLALAVIVDQVGARDLGDRVIAVG